MNDLFIGNNVVGNFKPQDKINPHNVYTLEKRDESLYLCFKNERIRLMPLDSEAENVVDLFDSNIGDDNSSIYKLSFESNLVIVILYTYRDTIRLDHIDQEMNIYVDRILERQLINEERYELYNIKSVKDIPMFLKDQFINNKSVFVQELKRNRSNNNSFQIFGKNLIATVNRERSGVYSINKFTTNIRNNKEFSFDLVQLFGKINFVTFNDSLSISSAEVSPLASYKTNEIFSAWDQFMDFKVFLYEENLRNSKIIHFSKFEVDGDTIIFDIPNEEELSSFEGVDCDFEMISSHNDTTLPTNPEGIIDAKKSNRVRTVYLGRCLNDSYDSRQMRFNFTNRVNPASRDDNGIIYISNFSLEIEKKRRDEVTKAINSRKNVSANIIMKLSDETVKDGKVGRNIEPIRDEVLVKMFGKPIPVKENYRQAMFTALNTPDIALIQGPPGTGKTTLIKGIIARLNMLGKNTKILISSEQHEALGNVVDKLATNKFIPPFVSSSRQYADETAEGEDQENRERIVRKFQSEFASLCDSILREAKIGDDYSKSISKIVLIFKEIRDSNYSVNKIKEIFDDLTNQLMAMNYLSDVKEEYNDLNEALFRVSVKKNDESDFTNRLLINKIKAQRLSLDVYLSDDGRFQMEDLQNKLKRFGFNEHLLSKGLYDAMSSLDDSLVRAKFSEYISYVEDLKDIFIEKNFNELDNKKDDFKYLTENLYNKIISISRHHSKNFYDIVTDLKYRLNDIDNASEIIQNYTSVIGSTCAQAGKSLKYVDLSNNKYDYVIIDEAARANPLDIMIPMMLGVNVILVGDHKQLPHYIETDFAKRFEQSKGRYSEFDKKLLTTSLFALMYENLEKAYGDGRLSFKRTAQIQEQHRMHPTIGNFISNEFYEGSIINGEKTINNVNDYHVFDSKNVVWVDMPHSKGEEKPYHSSYFRLCEANKAIDIIKMLVRKNPNRKLNIGIISFYGEQVNLMKDALKQNFPIDILENISCNTVDSYQGKEFDIVIISGVRSNDYSTPEKSLGFIHHSSSRINVALSRGKRLLIMIGDSKTYRRNLHFRNFIDYVKKEGYYE